MDGSKVFKTLRYLSVFVFVFLACVFFYISTDPFRKIQESLPWQTQYKQEREELGKVLKAASMPDRTVILTTLNEAWAQPGSIIDLFLESFLIGEGTHRLLNHLVIIAMDPKAFHRCKSIHKHCFFLTTPGVNFTAEKRFMTPDYLKLMWRRIDFLRVVLELGYNFVFTDADIMWFRDPFPYLDSDVEFQIACDYYKGNPTDKRNMANGGFNYVRSLDTTINFYKYWYMARLFYPNLHDQAVFEKIKHQQRIATVSGLRIEYLDTRYFGGFCEPSKDIERVCTMHANCCVGIESKIYDLKLILSDWRNFTASRLESKGPLQVSRLENKGLDSSSSPWSAPLKCRTWR